MSESATTIELPAPDLHCPGTDPADTSRIVKNQQMDWLKRQSGVTAAQWALVNLPDAGLTLYPTYWAALTAAVDTLCEWGDVTRLDHVEGEPAWTYAGDTYLSPQGVLRAYQQQLGAIEYFHVLPVN